MGNVLLKIVEELLSLALCLFCVAVKISNYETFCTHKASDNHFIKLKSCNALSHMLLVCIRSYLK